MAYRDIQPPIVGDKQSIQVNGQTTLIDLKTYLGYINENLAQPMAVSQTYINGVAAEKITFPAQTTSNVSIGSGLGILLQPMTFPTAGLIQKTVQTPFGGGSLYALLQCEAVCITSQANVVPCFGIRIEKQDLVTGAFDTLHEYDPIYWYEAAHIITYAAGDIVPMGYLLVVPNTQPGTNYRVTPLGGTWNNSGALPTTASWSVDATGTNTFQFVVWTGG